MCNHTTPSNNLNPYAAKSVYYSDITEPINNLSAEEYLMSICKPNEIILFLWVNSPSIIIGKHQNPYKECDLVALNHDKIKIVRRLSGGGTVYNDLGNLNFSFISHKLYYNIYRHFSVILNALESFNIYGHTSSRNDLLVNNKKFSGNAFIHRKSVACHHGTLLIDTNLSNLVKYLNPTSKQIIGKGIESVSSKVINLNTINKSVTFTKIIDAITVSFDEEYSGQLICQKLPNTLPLENYINKYKSWTWIFGSTPKYQVSYNKTYTWGTLSMNLTIIKGFITKCNLQTSPITDSDFNILELNMIGQPLRTRQLLKCIEETIKKANYRNDLYDFIISTVSPYHL